MWRGRIAMLMVMVTAGATAGAVVTGPAPVLASPAGRNEPVLGDFNGDSFVDRAQLGSVAPDYCSVVVEYGRADGFAPPVAYIYLRPGRDPGGQVPCPDIGVAVELDPGHPHDELVVAWFAGPPVTVAYNLLVLRSFRPEFGLAQAIFAPSRMETADFNGDGRMDVYAVTDEGLGFASYLSLGDGTLTPGPVRWCAVPVAYQVYDFDLDGTQDLLMAYRFACTDQANGVVVVLDDGTVRQLEHDPTNLDDWTARVVHANSDRFGDVRARSLTTGQTSYFINRGDGSFVEAPQANPDAVYPTTTGKILINVLANDWATSAARVTIVTPPAYGTVQVLSDRRIAYTPTVSPPRTDRFVYRLTEGGRQSTTSVYVRYSG